MSATTLPRAVIVGVGPGLGIALARRFAAGGHAVTGIGRHPPSGDEQAGVVFRQADAADPDALARAIGAEPVRVLIYNAYRATMAQGGPSMLDPGALVEDFRVNVAGALASARAVLPGMLAARQGTILLTGGGLALDPTGWLPAASLAIGKAGLRSLALTLHAELAPQGIHAGTVTIAGQIETSGPFNPASIADAFWELAQDKPGAFRSEVTYRG